MHNHLHNTVLVRGPGNCDDQHPAAAQLLQQRRLPLVKRSPVTTWQCTS
jgi:hypothetical protein